MKFQRFLSLLIIKINPEIVRIGPFSIKWYGLAYVSGLAVGVLIIKNRLKTRLGFSSDEIVSGLIYHTVGIILGGRIGYILFYNLPYYLSNPVSMPAVWKGGMSFHGALLGSGIALWLFSRKYVKSLPGILDLTALASTIGLFLGRIANFINGELYGRVTSVWWAVIFPNGGMVTRHPSQLYEAFFEGVVLFVILYGLDKYARLKEGQLLAVFLVGYGVFRFFIEYFREPDPQVGYVMLGLTLGQLLCIMLVLLGVGIFSYLVKKR
ncbi:prolipoprotein diacylglyceryl transferase [Thermoproteota archaeon]